MKPLFHRQQIAHNFFVQRLRKGNNTLDSSQMGTGKTVVGAQVAKTLLDRKVITGVAVICPKAVFPSWKAELEECGIDPIFILNLEKLRTGKTEFVRKIGKKTFRWMLPKTHGRGPLILFDEVHKAKGPWTQNANLLIALKRWKYLIHSMSGTPCENPIEMRPLGYVLGLHSNDKNREGKLDWWKWMRKLKVKAGFHGGFEMTDIPFALNYLRKAMYGVSTHGLTVKDFPDSFRANRVIVDPIEFSSNKKIVKSYDSLKLTPAQVTDYIEKGIVPDDYYDEEDEEQDPIIVKILKTRMESELHKVKDIVALARDGVDEGHNVVVFLNFRESLVEAASLLDCDYIDGSVKEDVRNQIIEDFQADKTNCVVINAATGGTGISLHDTHGNRPRLSLISPSFNAKEFSQVLGRIHRNGAKSDALQKVMLSSGSIEEYVMKAISKKMDNMNMIHHSQTSEMNSSYYK
jgi:superfamily II DNA or RNA helicase